MEEAASREQVTRGVRLSFRGLADGRRKDMSGLGDLAPASLVGFSLLGVGKTIGVCTGPVSSPRVNNPTVTR